MGSTPSTSIASTPSLSDRGPIPVPRTTISSATTASNLLVTTPATTTTIMITTAATLTATTTSTSSVVPKNLPTLDTSTAPVSTEGTSELSLYSVVKSFNLNADKTIPTTSSAFAGWYKWNESEQAKRVKDTLWYMSSPVTSSDIPSATTTTITMAMANMSSSQNEASDISNIIVMPSFQLRSTAVYSPPDDDRFLSGRQELITTNVSNGKHYTPDDRLQKTVDLHTKATMYKMNTRLRQIPLPTQPSSLTNANSNSNNDVTGDNSTFLTYVSRDLRTDLGPKSINPFSSQMNYYHGQNSQIVPVSPFPNQNSNNSEHYHSSPNNTSNQPIPPSRQKASVRFNDQPPSSLVQSFPSDPLSFNSRPPLPILKKPSTVSSQETPNLLSTQRHNEMLEKLLKNNNNNITTKNYTYEVKKVHPFEKSEFEKRPVAKSLDSPSGKARQSISRSEKLLFS